MLPIILERNNKMIACVDTNLLNKSKEIQKDINVEKIISSIKYFESKEVALKDGFVPLCFATTVRTNYSNLVVQHNHKGFNKYYVTLHITDPIPHKGYDLVMFMSSVAISKLMDCTQQNTQKLMFNSQFIPLGLYNPDPSICDPILYSQVVVHDDMRNELEYALLEGNTLVPICNIDTLGNFTKLVDEIIIVKEGN